MNKFNKWNYFLAKIIKNTFYKFKGIYGYQMIILWINKIYNLTLKSHIVYRYMRLLKLKSKIRKKRHHYVPREPNSSFEPIIVLKRQRRFDNFDQKVISLYARTMTISDIKSQLQELYHGAEISESFLVNCWWCFRWN